MTQDDINKIETLIGYVTAAGEGKYPLGDKDLLDVAIEAEQWVDEIKKNNL